MLLRMALLSQPALPPLRAVSAGPLLALLLRLEVLFCWPVMLSQPPPKELLPISLQLLMRQKLQELVV
jgi:hypothetical protein